MKNNLLLLFLLCLTLSSCAPEGYTEHEYGFFSGIWHGLCFPFALIGKLFGSDIGLYAENNTGFFYWLGYILGLFSDLGGGYRYRRRDEYR
jgi:hypothetical protein